MKRDDLMAVAAIDQIKADLRERLRAMGRERGSRFIDALFKPQPGRRRELTPEESDFLWGFAIVGLVHFNLEYGEEGNHEHEDE